MHRACLASISVHKRPFAVDDNVVANRRTYTQTFIPQKSKKV